MNPLIRICCLCVVCVLLPSCAEKDMNPPPAPDVFDQNLTVNLTVSLHKVWDDKCVIDLNLTNTGKSDLESWTHSLPWNGQYSMMLLPMDTHVPEGKPIPRLAIIDDPTPDSTTLKPRESKQGEIQLATRFPDLVKVLKKRDVVLFWSYQPITTKQTIGKRVSGSLLLPKLP
jgi:hypothetical protein